MTLTALIALSVAPIAWDAWLAIRERDQRRFPADRRLGRTVSVASIEETF